MAHWRTTLALLLGVILVAQGFAYAQAGASELASIATEAAEMPCHDAETDASDCCCPDASCPDMAACQAGHAVAASANDVARTAVSDVVFASIPPPRFTNDPTSVFRPPIALHG